MVDMVTLVTSVGMTVGTAVVNKLDGTKDGGDGVEKAPE